MSATEWRGKIALITGAGSGFGLELARIAARAGMRLVMVDVQTDALAAAVQNVVLHSVTFACVSCLQQHVRHAHAVLLQIRGLAAAQPGRWIC
jgi:NAD(P)-dependent dehydrogenase (short-subunit alcohol dehydrogenase family)